MSLGKKIYANRIKMGYSQEDFATQLKVSRQAVSKWERDLALPDLYNLKNIAKLVNISIDELISKEDEDDNSLIDVEVKTESWFNKFGLYALLIGATIHLSTSFIGGIDWIIYVRYLETGNFIESSFLIWLIRFIFGISFFGYIFYYIGYLRLISLFEVEFKKNTLILLGINFFLIAINQLFISVGINSSELDFLVILINITTLLVNLNFMKIILASRISSQLKKVSMLIFYAFILEIVLIIISNFNQYFINDQTSSSMFAIIIYFGYSVANSLFLIFSIWLIQERNNSEMYLLKTKDGPIRKTLMKKIRINGVKIIVFALTPIVMTYFIAIGLNGPVESIGVAIFGLFIAFVYGIVMLLVEKIIS
jgi:transcriptional regulator with XRE-family HTH domain